MLRRIMAWCRRRGARVAQVSLERVTPRPSAGQREASRALYETECARDAVRELGPQVTEAAAKLQALRTRNHFAEMIRASFEGSP